jgi:tetratricopeptide (TPR) repeat protein
MFRSALIAAALLFAAIPATAQQNIKLTDLADRCSDALNPGDPKQALAACEHAINVALPLAQAALGRGFSELGASNPRQALTEFENSMGFWVTALTGLFGKELAWGFSSNTSQLLLARQERNTATFLITEAWMRTGMAQLALGRRSEAVRPFTEALESNQEVIEFFKDENKASTLGRAFYLRGIAKAALAELASSRGSLQEACDAFGRSKKLGFKPSARWMSTIAAKTC